jgi:xeroderma pigmentosum group C-complementing protein
MLAEAGVSAPEQASPERPLKRRRPGSGEQDRPPSTDKAAQSQPKPGSVSHGSGNDNDNDEEIEFEDVVLPTPTLQTMELESDEEDEEDDEDEDIRFVDVDFSAPLPDSDFAAAQSSNLELNLTAHQSASSPLKRAGERRKPISKEEKERRVDIHRTHLLCLLSHVARRNHWCNDTAVQDSLRPHLTDKTVNFLTPGPHLPQFGQAESLKNAAADVWKTKFEITERGLRRALWAEDVQQLQDVSIVSTTILVPG